jgi:hypothetical protein
MRELIALLYFSPANGWGWTTGRYHRKSHLICYFSIDTIHSLFGAGLFTANPAKSTKVCVSQVCRYQRNSPQYSQALFYGLAHYTLRNYDTSREHTKTYQTPEQYPPAVMAPITGDECQKPQT